MLPMGTAGLSPAMQAVAVQLSQVGRMARQTGSVEILGTLTTAMHGGIA